MADPHFAVNCVKCGAPLTFLLSIDDSHVYQCLRHGLMVLSPDGRLRPETSAEVEARITRSATIPS